MRALLPLVAFSFSLFSITNATYAASGNKLPMLRIDEQNLVPVEKTQGKTGEKSLNSDAGEDASSAAAITPSAGGSASVLPAPAPGTLSGGQPVPIEQYGVQNAPPPAALAPQR